MILEVPTSSEDFENAISKIAEDLMSGKNLKDHGFRHVKRVANYGKMIMKSLDSSECVLDVLTALYCHDIGRLNDEVDIIHGISGADIFKKEIYPLYEFLDLPSIYFTIANHQNYKSNTGSIPVVQNYSFHEKINILVPMIVWDADRLDLPRIPKFFGKVNTEYLHTDFAKSYANTPEHLAIYSRLTRL